MDTDDVPFTRFIKTFLYLFNGPVDYIREKIVLPNQQKYPWYHRQFPRVTPISECYENDIVCLKEAEYQFQLDRMVDSNILGILRKRYENCSWYYEDDKDEYCADLYKIYNDAATAWFMKYGELGVRNNVIDAFMKQKHRMVWERRHGPVGSGITNKKYDFDLPKWQTKGPSPYA